MKEYKALISKLNGDQLEFWATEEECKRNKNLSFHINSSILADI